MTAIAKRSGVWGARFSQKSSDVFKKINDSLPIDHLLVHQDIRASKAWALGLKQANVISAIECQQLHEALDEVEHELAAKLHNIPKSAAEDIHTWLEWQLIDKVGELGKKIHTGRSRNDQVITAFKLWYQEVGLQLIEKIQQVMMSLSQLAFEHIDMVMPGYTHLQKAQPMSFGHWLHAFVDMLGRDLMRLQQALDAHNTCPLGSAALTGNAFSIDRQLLTGELGFTEPTTNSLDSVSSRDFVTDMLYVACQSCNNLSRFAEDVIFFASDEVGFISLSDCVASGSSIMPQKKNPDSLELLRSKAGAMTGLLTGFLCTLKALPMGYNKDLQTDKETLFKAVDDWMLVLTMVNEVVNNMKPNEQHLLQSIINSFANATEVADYLALKGVPFRDAHSIVGKLVNQCEERGCYLSELSLADFVQHSKCFEADIFEWLQPTHALARRRSIGGTAPKQIKKNIVMSLHHYGMLKLQKAQIEDVQPVVELVDYWAKAGEHLPRKATEIFNHLSQFWVIKDVQGKVLAVGSLIPMGNQLVEVRSLGVSPEMVGSGIGQSMIMALESAASNLGYSTIFALTRVPSSFITQGYKQVDISTLPQKALVDCQMCPKQTACDEVAVIKNICVSIDDEKYI